MLQSLRQSSSRVGRMLLPLLLLSWLSVFCGNCFAWADALEAASQTAPTEHSDSAHHCCDEPQPPCLGAGCDHDADQALMAAVKPASDPAPFAWLALLPAERSLNLQRRPDNAMPGAIFVPESIYVSPACYLRHCAFLI